MVSSDGQPAAGRVTNTRAAARTRRIVDSFTAGGGTQPDSTSEGRFERIFSVAAAVPNLTDSAERRALLEP
jgi:hypothetical protein